MHGFALFITVVYWVLLFSPLALLAVAAWQFIKRRNSTVSNRDIC